MSQLQSIWRPFFPGGWADRIRGCSVNARQVAQVGLDVSEVRRPVESRVVVVRVPGARDADAALLAGGVVREAGVEISHVIAEVRLVRHRVSMERAGRWPLHVAVSRERGRSLPRLWDGARDGPGG